MPIPNPKLVIAACLAAALLTGYASIDRAQALTAKQRNRALIDDATLALVFPPIGMTLAVMDGGAR